MSEHKNPVAGSDTLVHDEEQIFVEEVLAERAGSGVEVYLLWDKANDKVRVAVYDATNGESFSVNVDPKKALDAFYHPFAYAKENSSGEDVRQIAGSLINTVQVTEIPASDQESQE
jgi:hypothetical protein